MVLQNLKHLKPFHTQPLMARVEYKLKGRKEDLLVTANQINRVNALTQRDAQREQARHNLVTEEHSLRDVQSNELYRDRSGRAAISQASAAHRQAGAAESQAVTAAQRAVEEARHNQRTESLTAVDVATRQAAQRHTALYDGAKLAHQKQFDYDKLDEQTRAAKASERETRRHNVASEKTAAQTAVAQTLRGQAAYDRVQAQNLLDQLRAGDILYDDFLEAIKFLTKGLDG